MDLRNLFSHDATKRKVTIGFVLCFVMATLTGFASTNKNITVVADGNQKVISTVYNNPQSILKQAGINLQENDDYSVSTGDVRDNSVITVNRAVPVNIEIDGNTKTIKTAKKTVGELMSSLNLDEDKYFVDQNKNAQINTNSTIKVLNVSTRLVLKDEVQPYNVIKEPDSSLIKVSNRSDLSSAIPIYFSFCSSGISGASLSRLKYPITVVKGVRISWAKYITNSFFFVSASFAACWLKRTDILIWFIWLSTSRSGSDSSIAWSFCS